MDKAAILQREALDSKETINLLKKDIESERLYSEELLKSIADQKTEHEKEIDKMNSKIL